MTKPTPIDKGKTVPCHLGIADIPFDFGPLVKWIKAATRHFFVQFLDEPTKSTSYSDNSTLRSGIKSHEKDDTPNPRRSL